MNTTKRMGLRSLAILTAAALSGGCNCGSTGADDGGGDDDAGPTEPSIASSRANLRFKDGKRLRNDLGQVLSLDSAEICTELGQYDCVDEIHTISLLGVAPHDLGFYEPLKETAVTTPLAVERVVISACSTRVDLDFADPASATIFKDLAVSGGELSEPGGPAALAAIDLLYKRSLLRAPTEDELGHLTALYDDVVATGTATPAQGWAKGACFAILTSLENLFY